VVEIVKVSLMLIRSETLVSHRRVFEIENHGISLILSSS
jgi:hypothetical protein